MFKQFNPTFKSSESFEWLLFQQRGNAASKWVGINLKNVLILSHGQASDESSFCVSNTIFKDNLKCKSITARKTIIDHMKSKWLKTHTVPGTKDLLHSVKPYRSRYQEHLRQQRKESKENETATQLSLLNANIKEIELRKKGLIDFCDSMDKEFLGLTEKTEKKQDLKLLSKAQPWKEKQMRKGQKFLC